METKNYYPIYRVLWATHHKISKLLFGDHSVTVFIENTKRLSYHFLIGLLHNSLHHHAELREFHLAIAIDVNLIYYFKNLLNFDIFKIIEWILQANFLHIYTAFTLFLRKIIFIRLAGNVIIQILVQSYMNEEIISKCH